MSVTHAVGTPQLRLGAAAICAMWLCYVLNVSVCLCVGSVHRDGVTDQKHSTGEHNDLMRHERPDDAEGHYCSCE